MQFLAQIQFSAAEVLLRFTDTTYIVAMHLVKKPYGWYDYKPFRIDTNYKITKPHLDKLKTNANTKITQAMQENRLGW